MKIQLKDQIKSLHSFSKIPSRIVSLVPSQTELLFDLGLEDSIVGITKFCVHPDHFLKTKNSIGGTKSANFDKIKDLNPDIIICNKEENTKEIVAFFSVICPVWVTDITTIEDNNKMISDFGHIFNKVTEAQILNQKIKTELIAFKIFVKEKPVLKTAYFIWKKPYMVAAASTFIDQLLQLNNFENHFRDQTRYPEIEIENLKTSSLDLILLSSEPFPFKEKDKTAFQEFFPKSKIIIVDGEMFSWHGSRLLKAFDYFRALHQLL